MQQIFKNVKILEAESNNEIAISKKKKKKKKKDKVPNSGRL